MRIEYLSNDTKILYNKILCTQIKLTQEFSLDRCIL